MNELNDDVVNTIIKNFDVYDVGVCAGPTAILNPYLTKTVFTYTNPELESVKLPNLVLAHPKRYIITSFCDKIETIEVPNLLPALPNEHFFIYNCYGNRNSFKVFVNREMFSDINKLAHNSNDVDSFYAKDILKHLEVVNN